MHSHSGWVMTIIQRPVLFLAIANHSYKIIKKKQNTLHGPLKAVVQGRAELCQFYTFVGKS